MNKRVISSAIPITMIAAVAAMVGYANWRAARTPQPKPVLPIGTPGASSTSRENLTAGIKRYEERLAQNPDDGHAAVALADVLMRQARVTGNAGLANKAERALLRVLQADSSDYPAQRMLGAVYLSEHRFAEAIRAAQKARDLRPSDAWNYGVMGDGHLELGDYEQAFDAFDTMVKMRPSAAAYGRIAYARELQGNLQGALEAMKMASDATTGHDPESQAWHFAQLGNLYLELGRVEEAAEQYQRAHIAFPNHPFALAGFARLRVARGDYAGALELYLDEFQKTPGPDAAVALGDLYGVMGNKPEAERYYALAEAAWRFDQPQPAMLARFLADRDRKIDAAVTLAEQAASERHDIFTEDSLAWAYFKAGRTEEAATLSRRALRTGSRDRHILYHAAAIAFARGHREEARGLLERTLGGNPHFDLVSAPAAAALLDQIVHPGALARR